MTTRTGKFYSRGILAGLFIALLFLLLALAVLWWSGRDHSELPKLGEVPPFSFIERSGGAFGFSEMKGKISIVDFIFTRCQGACPLMAGKMVKFYNIYKPHPAVQFISISVDPQFDTPALLRQYAADQGVTDDRWLFLNGAIEEVIRLSEQGFKLPADDLPAGHSSKFVLVDRQAHIRGYYDSFDERRMSELDAHIRYLLKRGGE